MFSLYFLQQQLFPLKFSLADSYVDSLFNSKHTVNTLKNFMDDSRGIYIISLYFSSVYNILFNIKIITIPRLINLLYIKFRNCH
jgi:hypothetical protein